MLMDGLDSTDPCMRMDSIDLTLHSVRAMNVVNRHATRNEIPSSPDSSHVGLAFRRLEGCVDRGLAPASDPMVFNIRFIKPDGTEAPGGFKVEFAASRPARGDRLGGTRPRGWSPSRGR